MILGYPIIGDSVKDSLLKFCVTGFDGVFLSVFKIPR